CGRDRYRCSGPVGRHPPSGNDRVTLVVVSRLRYGPRPGLHPGRGPSPFLPLQVRGRRADARSRAPIPAPEMTHRAIPRSEESARKPTRGGKPRNPTRPSQLTTVTPSPVRTPGMLPAAAKVRGKSVDTP